MIQIPAIILLTSPVWAATGFAMQAGAFAWAIHPLVMSCMTLGVAGVCLLLVAGPSAVAARALRSRWTWLFGAVRLINSVVLVTAGLHGSLVAIFALQRLSVLPLFLLAARQARRPISRVELALSVGLVLSGGMLASHAVIEGRWLSILLVVIGLCLEATITRIAEIHPVGRDLRTFRERAAYTGAVLAVSAAVLLAFAVILHSAVGTGGVETLGRVSHFVASAGSMPDSAQLAFCVIVALLLRLPAMWLYLRLAPQVGALRLNGMEAGTLLLIVVASPFLLRQELLPPFAPGALEIALALLIAALSYVLAFVSPAPPKRSG